MEENLTKVEREVLSYFFLNPREEKHVRGIARELEIPHTTVRSSLEKLKEENLVKGRKEGNMRIFSARREDERFIRQKRIFNLDLLYQIGIIERLEETLRPEAIVLFGSYLHGRDHEESDIDLAVVNGREDTISLKKFEQKTQREINLVRVEDAQEVNTGFKNTLANGYVLKGYLEIA